MDTAVSEPPPATYMDLTFGTKEERCFLALFLEEFGSYSSEYDINLTVILTLGSRLMILTVLSDSPTAKNLDSTEFSTIWLRLNCHSSTKYLCCVSLT